MRGSSGPAVRPRRLVDDGPGIEQRVVLGEDRPLERVPARVGQLQADQQVVVASVRLDVGLRASRGAAARAPGRCASDDELAGIGPALRERPRRPRPRSAWPRRRRSGGIGGRSARPGEPSGSPSQPSIGWIASRLPTRRPPTSIGRKSGERSALSSNVQAQRLARRPARPRSTCT